MGTGLSITQSIPISTYLNLGGNIDSLVGKVIYRNNKVRVPIYTITEVIRRTTKKGINKGKEVIEFVIEVSFSYNTHYNYTYKSKLNYDTNYIEVNLMLTTKEMKVDNILNRIESFVSVVSMINKELINIYGKDKSNNPNRSTM